MKRVTQKDVKVKMKRGSVTQEDVTQKMKRGSVTQEDVTQKMKRGSVTQEAVTEKKTGVSVTQEAVTEKKTGVSGTQEAVTEKKTGVSVTQEDVTEKQHGHWPSQLVVEIFGAEVLWAVLCQRTWQWWVCLWAPACHTHNHNKPLMTGWFTSNATHQKQTRFHIHQYLSEATMQLPGRSGHMFSALCC